VSKKSLSITAKIVRIAVTKPSFVNAWNGSCRPSPIVEKLGVVTSVVSTFWTPTTIATTVVTRMLMISDALRPRA
jgi:hypothetical protein